MKPKDLGLLHGYLNETLSEAEFGQLQNLLRESSEARETLRTLSTVDTRLVELGAGGVRFPKVGSEADSGFEFVRPKSNLSKWRPWLAAAAGLIIGLFSATMVFAYVMPFAAKAVCLLNEGFESGPAPLVKGMPRKPGVWSGDYSAVVGEEQGVKPLSGRKMLRMLRADYEGKSPQFSYSGDLYRIIDLRGSEADLFDGKAMVTVEVNFQGIPYQSTDAYTGSIAVNALATLPEGDEKEFTKKYLDRLTVRHEGEAGEFIPASSQRSFRLNPEGGKWQKVRVELRVPPGTKFLLLETHVFNAKAGGEGRKVHGDTAMEFPGQYIDDVQVYLIRNAAVF